MKVPKTILGINICGALGYMFLLAVWALFVATVLGLLFDAIEAAPSTVIIPNAEDQPSGAAPSSAVLVAGYVLAVVLGLISLGVAVTAPYFVGKWGSRFVRWLMKVAKIDVTRSQLFLVKGMLAALPLMGLLMIHFLMAPGSITFAALYASSVGLSAVSLVCFLVQLLLVRRFNIPVDKVW